MYISPRKRTLQRTISNIYYPYKSLRCVYNFLFAPCQCKKMARPYVRQFFTLIEPCPTLCVLFVRNFMMLIWFSKKHFGQFFVDGTDYDFHPVVVIQLVSFISNSFNTCFGFISYSILRREEILWWPQRNVYAGK